MFRYEMYRLLRRKQFYFAVIFGIVLACVSCWFNYNYVYKPELDSGVEKFYMWEDLSFSLGVDGMFGWPIISTIICFWFVVPYADSYMDDLHDGVLPSIFLRGERKKYVISKIIVTYIGTFLALIIPLLFSQFLCKRVYYRGSNPWDEDDLYGVLRGTRGRYLQKKTLFADVYFKNYALYYFLFACFLAAVLSLIACGLQVVVLNSKNRFIRILIFFPVFVLNVVTSRMTDIHHMRYMHKKTNIFLNYKFMDYLAPGTYDGKYYPFLWGLLALVVLYIVWGSVHWLKKPYESIVGGA